MFHVHPEAVSALPISNHWEYPICHAFPLMTFLLFAGQLPCTTFLTNLQYRDSLPPKISQKISIINWCSKKLHRITQNILNSKTNLNYCINSDNVNRKKFLLKLWERLFIILGHSKSFNIIISTS